jgi:hypothetical protein
MTTTEIAQEVVRLSSQGQFLEAIDNLYADDVLSVETNPMPDGTKEFRGREAVRGKNIWWLDNHELHGTKADGPLVAGNHFCVRFWFDVTFKPGNRRYQIEELAIYEAKDGKIVREEFFYSM